MGVLRLPSAPPILPKMFRLWVIGLLLPSLALARILPFTHLNQLRVERVKDPTFNGFVDSDDNFKSDESFEEYSNNDSIESGESDLTRLMPILPASEDQEMRFRYALSQVLLPPAVEEEVNEQEPGSSSLKLPQKVQQERASMLMHGENYFQPYENLDEEEGLDEKADLDNFEDLEGNIDKLPEYDVWERYRRPEALDVEVGFEDYEEDQDEWQEEEEEEEMNNNEEDRDEENKEEEDEDDVKGEKEAEEEADDVEEEEEAEEEEEEEEDWLPELSAGVKYRGPSIMVEVPK